MRKLLAGLAASAVLTTTALVAPAAAQAATWCGIRWGSLEKGTTTIPGFTPSQLTNVRAGRHQCYDRLVLDFRGPGASASRVGYVPAVPYQARDGSVALRGAAFLNIVLLTTSYDPSTGASTYTPANYNELVDVNGWRTFRQIAYGGSYEAHTTIGLGVRARLPFRVFSLAGPGGHSRLVIDVAHRWSSSSAAVATELPAPTGTSAVSVTHGQQLPPQSVVTAIRLGRHPAYDRVVFDINGAMPSYLVRYWDGVFSETDRLVPLRGAAALTVSVNSLDNFAHPAAEVPGRVMLPTIRDVESFDGFEGYLGYAVGTTGHNGFRVFELQHPTRLVVDIAHDLPAPTSMCGSLDRLL